MKCAKASWSCAGRSRRLAESTCNCNCTFPPDEFDGAKRRPGSRRCSKTGTLRPCCKMGWSCLWMNCTATAKCRINCSTGTSTKRPAAARGSAAELGNHWIIILKSIFSCHRAVRLRIGYRLSHIWKAAQMPTKLRGFTRQWLKATDANTPH